MAKKSLKELKEVIVVDINYQLSNISLYEGNKNPQIIEMSNNSKIRAEALNDVLEYIKTGAKCQFYKSSEVKHI
jgi:hypothetical protein